MSADREELRQRLWRLFLDELDDHGGRLERGLDALSGALPEVPEATVAELFRSAHSLKGAAQAVGSPSVATVCHELESLLARVRDGDLTPDHDLVGSLGAAVDLLVTAAGRLRDGADLTDVEVRSVVAALSAHRARDPRTPHRPTSVTPPATPSVVALEPPAAVAAPDDPTGSAPDAASVRVAAQTLDLLMSLAEELGTVAYRTERFVGAVGGVSDRLGDLLDGAEGQAAETVSELDALVRDGAASARALRGLADSLADVARQARTVPFSDATTGLARVVQDVCGRSRKRADLVVETADARIDRALVATLNDVLRHLVRNAVDHGIESPALRESRGKPAAGTVTIAAALRSDTVAVTVSDDGQGVDLEAVAAVTGARAGTEATERVLVEALFQPGVSTAKEISPVSGRGVGLDVVRTEVEALGGAVTLESVRGEGTRIGLTLPLTLSTMRALLVLVARELVALPSSAIRTITHVRPADLVALEGGEAAMLDGVALPLVRLGRALGWASGDPEPRGDDAGWPALVVVAAEGPALLLVDGLVEEREVVVRASSPRLAGVPGLLGTSLLEDGTAALVMSPTACVRLGLASPRPVEERSPDDDRPARRLLLAEDTLTTRELERSILEAAGYSVLVARDGAEAWQLLQEHTVDGVVTDCNMPRMDGIALCRAVRSAPRTAGLPLVLVTSLASDEDRRAGLEAGADAYITKSGFGRDELLDTLERLL